MIFDDITTQNKILERRHIVTISKTMKEFNYCVICKLNYEGNKFVILVFQRDVVPTHL